MGLRKLCKPLAKIWKRSSNHFEASPWLWNAPAPSKDNWEWILMRVLSIFSLNMKSKVHFNILNCEAEMN